MLTKKINSVLISVFDKDGLDDILDVLKSHQVTIYSTGGTQAYIEKRGINVHAVEDLTSYPSILDGRVKTLHPKVFGGLLARREEGHLKQLTEYDIPEIDAVIVDLYPFEETVANAASEEAIIEKIDIGGISLIRAAAKNYKDVVVVASKNDYANFHQIISENNCYTTLVERKMMARNAFNISSHYDTAIFNYFNKDLDEPAFKASYQSGTPLRYGENPHQQANFFGKFDEVFEKLNGKQISFNNLVDIDAALGVMTEFKNDDPTFAVLKHTNVCGIATRETIFEAWEAALAGDNISAFGGILISNEVIDLKTANAINELFYEVLIAPDFEQDALELLKKKKKRVLLKTKSYLSRPKTYKSILNGVVEMDTDVKSETTEDLKVVTKAKPTNEEIADLLFANKCAKHLKSNTIVLAKNRQLIGMGCGQTSRVDALKQAIDKAKRFGFSVENAVMASDAFFPFPDCVEIADKEGIKAVIQPGGSIKDDLSIAYCDEHEMSMICTGFRHFKH